MKTILTPIVSAIRTILLTFAIANSFVVLVSAQDRTNTPEKNPEIAEMLSTNPPPPGFATRLDYIRSFTKGKAIDDAYRAGKLSKEEAMLADMIDRVGPNDKTPMDTYGKVVDQYGQPVVGAKVRGLVGFEGPGDYEEHYTKTDSQGGFQFLGLHGKDLEIAPEKEGYEFNLAYKFLVFRPISYRPDPTNLLIIHMWKLRGAEPMMHTQLHAYIPCDGSATLFDLMTGKKSTNGDFTVKLTRNPLNIDGRKPFDWSVTFEITNGGFQEITNLAYPNEAPAEGYQSKMTFEFQANSTNWTSLLTPSLYFKSKDGQIYGRMAFKIMADFQPPPTLFDINIYANPGGSRNLEFDPNKQIRLAR